MKSIIACVVLLFGCALSIELHAQYNTTHCPIILKLNKTASLQKEGLSNISIGLGFAEAIRITPDEHDRNHDLRFLVNLNMTARIHHPFYLSLGFEYHKKDLDGYDNSYNLSMLLSLGGTAYKRKMSYFIEAGTNLLAIHYSRERFIGFSWGL